MKNKELSAVRIAKAKRYAALPVALIQRPLKFMLGGAFKGGRTRAPRWACELGRELADKGDGASVQRLARGYL